MKSTAITRKSFLSNLLWRNATKAFDVNRPVSDVDRETVLEAIRLAPTSFNLQPFDIYVVRDQAIKDQIHAVGWNQPQFKTASFILVFVARTDVSTRIDEYMKLISGGDAQKREQLAKLEKGMTTTIGKLSEADARSWADRQVYIALGFAMAACAELGVDSCPMEGFVPAEVDRVLKLSPHQKSSVMLTVGYRDPVANVRPKLRFPATTMFREV